MKKLLAFSTVLLIFAMSTSVSASEQIITPQITFTDEALNRIAQNDLKVQEYAKNKSILRAGGQNYLPVSLVIQAYKNYCGPATTEMVLKYKGKTQTTDNQASLASSWGMVPNGGGIDGYTMINTLNSKLGSGSYEILPFSTSNFASSLIYSIDKNYPVIYSVDISTLFYNNDYPASSGHYVVGNSYYYNVFASTGDDKLRYIEPFDLWKYKGYPAGEYEVPFSKMYDAIRKNPNGASYVIRYVGN